jgi:hypothetical protein
MYKKKDFANDRRECYAQYGCGYSAPSGWLNFDSSPTLRFERLPLIGSLYTKNKSRFPASVMYGDIVKGLPIPASSCSGIYCSHVLEHLSLEDFRTALRNTHQSLQPGGTFRLVLPDLAYYALRYLESSSDDAALQFMRDTSLGTEMRARGFFDMLKAWLGNSHHLWMWDYKSVCSELGHVGFVGIRLAVFGDSSDPAFKTVEEKDRWDNCVGIECRKM